MLLSLGSTLNPNHLPPVHAQAPQGQNSLWLFPTLPATATIASLFSLLNQLICVAAVSQKQV